LSIISLKTGRLADLILALDRQAAGQVAFAAGDVAQALAQFVERLGDEVAGDQVDDDQQGAKGASATPAIFRRKAETSASTESSETFMLTTPSTVFSGTWWQRTQSLPR
jgi:hypothetical protein